MLSPSHNPHDRFFRQAFAYPALVEEYVRHFLPPELARGFDLSTLEQQKESYLDKSLEAFFFDVVYTVAYGEKQVWLTLLLEHKSYVPPHPWRQLLRYLLNAYSAQAEHKGRRRLSPVIPIIVYHGKKRWKIRPVASYFEGIDAQLAPFIPAFRYLLDDLSDYSEADLLAMDGSWVKRAFLALKASREQPAFEGLQLVFTGLTEAEAEHIQVDFFHVLVVYLLQSRKPEERIDIMRAIDDLDFPVRDKIRTAYDQLIYMGMEEGMKKGREEGREEGFQKAAFQTFRKGVSMRLPLADLITLTAVSEATAQAWFALLQADPEAEWPGL
ncbi:MAG: Rpn family recombination-promoting nuclease/putative transposase [Bacteroidia bacterium]